MRLARNQLAIGANPQLPADLTIEDALHSIARPKPSFLGIDDDHAIVPGAAEHLPAEGRALYGELGPLFSLGSEVLVIRENKKSPGFFDLLHLEFFPDEESGSIHSSTKKPVRREGIRMFFEFLTHHRDFDSIEWIDCEYTFFGLYD